MTHAITPREQTTGAAEPRLSPLEAFVAWLASFLRTIAGLKRRKVFPPNWKDHWPGLRELEWYRDQILAFSAKHVLSGGSLDDRTNFQLIEAVPDGYGVCPRTPQAMNRRFIAMGQFRLDPDKYIQRHIHRIAKREGAALATCPTLRAEAESNVLACMHTGLSRRSAAKAEGRSRDCSQQSRARAPPPYSRLPIPHCLARVSAARSPPHARTQNRPESARRRGRIPNSQQSPSVSLPSASPGFRSRLMVKLRAVR